MNPKLLKLFHKYQKGMFYISQAGNEMGKPLRFMTEFGIIVLLLSDSGIKTTFLVKGALYLAVMIIAILIGKWLCNLGIVEYNTKLSNNHNAELKQIMKDIKEIKENLK